MGLLDESAKSKIKDFLEEMKDSVEILFFSQEIECPSCSDTRKFITEITDLSDKLNMTVYDFVDNKDEVESMNIDQIPAIAIMDKDGNDKGIRFYGVPGGYEINSFLSSLVEVSGNEEDLDSDIKERIQKIDKEINIKVFVSLSCPYCPKAVQNAHKLALLNKNITGEMIQTSTFPELTNKYDVSGVPKIVINNEKELVGAQPITEFLDAIESL